MWDVNMKKFFDYYGFYPDLMNSSIALPRIPPGKANLSLGISKAGNLKEDIIKDNASMLARLFDFQSMFQQRAAGLFDLSPRSQFGPGHPLYFRMNSIDSLQLENEHLKKENLSLKQQLDKHKQKQV